MTTSHAIGWSSLRAIHRLEPVSIWYTFASLSSTHVTYVGLDASLGHTPHIFSLYIFHPSINASTCVYILKFFSGDWDIYRGVLIVCISISSPNPPQKQRKQHICTVPAHIFDLLPLSFQFFFHLQDTAPGALYSVY